jgi:hypothetical protein
MALLIVVNANDQLSYTNTASLSNALTWNANTHVVSLEYLTISTESNTDIGWLPTTLTPVINNTPSSINNYTLNFTANSYQTDNFLANSVNPNERTLVVQTKFTANSGITQDAPNIYLRVYNSAI